MSDVIHDVKSAAERARRHPKTMLKALRKGELRGYQERPGCGWRIFESDLDRWIKGEQHSAVQKRRVAA